MDNFELVGAIMKTALTYEHSENVTDRIFSAIMRAHPDGGLELRARVWWGYKYENRQFVRDNDPGKLQCSEKLLRNNLLHSSYEFNHLRKLLPLIYAEEGKR